MKIDLYFIRIENVIADQKHRSPHCTSKLEDLELKCFRLQLFYEKYASVDSTSLYAVFRSIVSRFHHSLCHVRRYS